MSSAPPTTPVPTSASRTVSQPAVRLCVCVCARTQEKIYVYPPLSMDGKGQCVCMCVVKMCACAVWETPSAHGCCFAVSVCGLITQKAPVYPLNSHTHTLTTQTLPWDSKMSQHLSRRCCINPPYPPRLFFRPSGTWRLQLRALKPLSLHFWLVRTPLNVKRSPRVRSVIPAWLLERRLKTRGWPVADFQRPMQ